MLNLVQFWDSQKKITKILADMEFVQNLTPPDFQAKNFTLSISPNFNSFSKKKHKKISENGKIYTAGKNFTLPPAVTAWINSTSALSLALSADSTFSNQDHSNNHLR